MPLVLDQRQRMDMFLLEGLVLASPIYVEFLQLEGFILVQCLDLGFQDDDSLIEMGELLFFSLDFLSELVVSIF